MYYIGSLILDVQEYLKNFLGAWLVLKYIDPVQKLKYGTFYAYMQVACVKVFKLGTIEMDLYHDTHIANLGYDKLMVVSFLKTCYTHLRSDSSLVCAVFALFESIYIYKAWCLVEII